jgi:hypothetical protein
VPEGLDGVLPWSWAEERLVRARNYWVVTVDALGAPHATPVWGVWAVEQERFWFSCAPSSLKARNLRGNERVVVAPDDAVEVVSLEGVARRSVSDGGAVERDTVERDIVERDIADRYAAKYEPDPGKRAALAEFVLENSLFAVRPTKAIAVIEREDEFAARATRWVW